MKVVFAIAGLLLVTAAADAASSKPVIAKEQASRIALAEVPNGHIQSSELENEHHALVWSFDISRPDTRTITEILVDARTGKIVDVQEETLQQQNDEAAADRAGQK